MSPRPPHMSQVTGFGAGRGSSAVTGGTRDRGVEGELAAGAERRLGKLEVDLDQCVLATRPARTRAARAGLAEEGVHDVAEPEALRPTERGAIHAEVVTLPLLLDRTAPRRRRRPP